MRCATMPTLMSHSKPRYNDSPLRCPTFVTYHSVHSLHVSHYCETHPHRRLPEHCAPDPTMHTNPALPPCVYRLVRLLDSELYTHTFVLLPSALIPQFTDCILPTISCTSMYIEPLLNVHETYHETVITLLYFMHICP